MRRLRQLAAATLALVMFLASVLLASVTTATADSYGPETTQYGPIELPDDTGASYCFDSSWNGQVLQDMAHDAEEYLDDRTATYRIFEACNANDTDMVFSNADLPGGAGGFRWCTLGIYGVCIAGAVIIDVPFIFQVGADCAAYLGTDTGATINGMLVHNIRHEVGHAQGLHHGNPLQYPCTHGTPLSGGTDAMVSGVAFNSLVYFSYHDHHVCHVNAWLVYGVWQNTCT